MTATGRGRIIYFSHGGGPLPILGDASHNAMVKFMKQLPDNFDRPEAILVISAHWEEQLPTLLGSAFPQMFYDYHGFPEEAYHIDYPAPGNPRLADKIVELFARQDIQSRIDSERGFDHGLYIPLLLMYPAAEIPALQLSLRKSLDPAEHLAMGHALRELLQENILVIGSGFSFHNLSAFFRQVGNTADPANDAFQDWLIETCTGPLPQREREQRLLHWQQAPSALYCHPREEHLLPLHVCLAAANSPAEKIFDDRIAGKRAVAFQWNS